MLDVEIVADLLAKKQPMAAMVAPSFPVMYRYPDIIGRLRRLGFGVVVEVAAGAAKTNEALIAAFSERPTARFITSPCPSFVRLVRKKFPHLLPFVAISIDSPMAATARMMRTKYPDHRPVFIGPCFAKRMEAKEEHPDLGIVVITFVELGALLVRFGIRSEPGDNANKFDNVVPNTRMYPTDGGLTDSSGVRGLLSDREIRVVSGWKQCEAALMEFEHDPTIRLLDILFCEGGCINGPGIASPLSTAQRKGNIEAFYREK